LRQLAYLPVAIIVAAITAAAAHTATASPIPPLSEPSMAYQANPADDPDEPPTILAAGDFNRDGIADIVKATLPDGENSGPYVLTVQLGQADGTFRTITAHQPIGKDPRALVVGDFNGDGNLDVIVGDGSGSLQEFRGDGRGNLVGTGAITTLGSVASIAVGDFAHNGKLDLAVSDFKSNSAVVLLGAGDGSFRFAWSFELPRRGIAFNLSTADFNGDGVPDLVISNADDANYEVMLGNGNGTFTYAPELSHLRDPYSYCPS